MGRILIGNIKGPQGEAGKNFEYAKTYASVSAMNADFSGTDVAEGEYVVISAGIDDADNGRVYRKGTNSYVYVNRVNGPTGPRGATGPMPTLVTNLDTTTAGQGALDASVGPTIKGKVTKEGGETGDTVTTFNTSDTTTDAEIIEYTAMEKLTSGSPLKTLMSIMSKAVKNVRWFQKLLGTTDISGIGNGTVTNAVSTLNDALTTVNTKVTNRLKGYTTGSGTLNSQYWEESTLRYYIQDNLCFVYVSGHLKPVTGFTEIIVGSNFPKSIGSNYNISCVMDNDMNVVGMFSVNALGQFSITTRKALTASSTTVTGRLAYVIQDNYAP